MLLSFLPNLDLFTVIVRAICLLTTIPIHESAHAYVAYKLGDPTAKYRGRLTLNPARHFDLMGSVCMILFGIGWAQPVPINARNFKDSKKGMALSRARGPASNVIIAFFSVILLKIFLYTPYVVSMGSGAENVFYTLEEIFYMMASINISLAIFNLMPFPPFDGSRIFNYFLPDRFYFKVMEYERYIFMGIFLLLFLGILDTPLNFLANGLFSVLNMRTKFVDRFFIHFM